jgi:hypothetical protein
MKMIELEILLGKVSEFYADPDVYIELDTVDGKLLFNLKDISIRKTSETNFIVLTADQKELIKLTQ